ncbi:MAG: CxxxxCH/CxxCH domain-containing protein [Desulfuromonas sp.]|nr:CxxxxCH/CxxCH domain-containing protein [Desulfuromonas sp.]
MNSRGLCRAILPSWPKPWLRLSVGTAVLFAFFSIGAAAEAANGTTAGAVKVSAQDRSLIVSSPYSGDDNGDNTLLVEWDTQGGPWSGAGYGSATLPHAASPFLYTIAGLTNFTAYQIRITYQDGNGVSGANPQILGNLKPNNPLLHNSLTTGSLKWSAQNGWGIPGGRYGEFSCNTCHVKNSSNIKRVRATVDAPDSGVDFPGGNSAAVSFQSTVAGSADFGDDATAHATSNRVCEVCHTYDATRANGVKWHGWNMSAGGADTGHENKNDCVSCHQHSKGFSAGSCDECHAANGVGHTHGTENAALHDAHANSGYVAGCNTCHTHNGSGPDHLNGTVNFNNTRISNTYNYAKAAGFGGTCGATNGCHDADAGEWAAGNLGNAGDNPCQDCHGSSAGFFTLLQGWATSPQGPTSAKHPAHVGNTAFVSGCTSCHPHSGSGAQHVDTILQQTVSYVSATQTCTNSCHLANTTGDWTVGGVLACADCHNADGNPADLGSYSLDQGNWPPASGSHPAHIGAGASAAYGDTVNHSTAGAYEFGCGQCHGNAATAHANGIKTLAGTGWNGSTCNNSYCHSGKDATNTRVYATTPVWGTSFAGDKCAKCHGNSPESGGHLEHQVGFHYNAIYSGLKDFLPVLNSDPVPAGLAGAVAQLRGHGGTLLADGTPNSTTITCYVCHNDTVTGKANDQNPVCAGCHDGTRASLKGNAAIVDKSKHVNTTVDIQFVDAKIRSKAQVRDDLFNVPELSNNWTRMNTYKKNDGSSYDEQPQTLRAMATTLGGWNAADKSCQISCHLWEGGRVDKYPVQWEGGAIICIDCHTRLPK